MVIESKYDFDLDMVNTNSLSLIINQIKRGSTVLEFGPANGRMTKYLKEALDCKVYLVEIDEQAGKEALKYGEDLVVDDIETYSWAKRFEDIRFDYITFADVLEHLRDPEQVLIRAKSLLKQDGSILFSVPNLGHNSVMINLLNHEFEYTKVGLLDNTHIHFFTKNSIENAMNRAGLTVAKRFATYAPVGSTEIQTTYTAVAGIDESYWKMRPYGDIYQFVYEAKKGPEFVEETENYIKSGAHPYYIQIFMNQGDGFSENCSRIFPVEDPAGIQTVEFDVPEGVRSIRLDVLNAPCMIEMIEASDTITSDKAEGEKKPLRFMEGNAAYRDRDKYIFTTNDPVAVYAPAEGRTFYHVKFVFRYISVDALKVNAVWEYFGSVWEESARKLEEKEGQYQAALAELNNLKAENEVLRDRVDAFARSLNELFGSTSWKLTKPIRKLGDIIHRRKG